MTVGELKKTLEDVRDELEVVIDHPESMYHVGQAKFVRGCSIGNPEFWIVAGEGFEY